MSCWRMTPKPSYLSHQVIGFFVYYLAAPKPTLGYRGDNLTQSMLIIVNQSHREHRDGVRSLSPTKRLMEFWTRNLPIHLQRHHSLRHFPQRVMSSDTKGYASHVRGLQFKPNCNHGSLEKSQASLFSTHMLNVGLLSSKLTWNTPYHSSHSV